MDSIPIPSPSGAGEGGGLSSFPAAAAAPGDDSHRERELSLMEVPLRRIGAWTKRLAFVGTIHNITGNLSSGASVGLFSLATWISVWKILHDKQDIHGSRRYVSNLAGDDASIYLVRNMKDDGCIPWSQCDVSFLPSWAKRDGAKAPFRVWLQKAIDCSIFTVYR